MTETEREMRALTAVTSQRDSHWRTVFDKYDTDHDGYISYTELKNIVHSPDCQDFSHDAVDRIMKIADKNNSGDLDFEEFVDMMQNPDLQWAFGHYVDSYIRLVLTPAPHRYVKRTGRTYREEYSCWPPPIYMIIISVLEITLFSIDASKGHIYAEGDVAAIFIYDPSKRKEVWRFFTYMLVHFGYFHILSNLLVQLVVGFPLELVHRWRIVLVYLAGVGAGSLVSSLVDNSHHIAGASSGVYALSSAHIANIALNYSEKRYACVQLILFLIFVIVTLVLSPGALIPHGAGAVTGLLVGIGVLRNLEVRKWEKYLWWAAMSLYVLLMVGCVLAHIFWTSRFPKDELEISANVTQLNLGKEANL